MSRCNQPPSRALQQPTRQVALRQDAGGARLSLLSLGEFLTLLDTFGSKMQWMTSDELTNQVAMADSQFHEFSFHLPLHQMLETVKLSSS